MICRYAESVGKLDCVEVLGFVDAHRSINWIDECGGKVINLLAKGSYKHCTQQLKRLLKSILLTFVRPLTMHSLKACRSIYI